jgi:hypothetical protein
MPACTLRLRLPAFYSASKNPDTKTPHTCISQPHGGYCLRKALMILIIIIIIKMIIVIIIIIIIIIIVIIIIIIVIITFQIT